MRLSSSRPRCWGLKLEIAPAGTDRRARPGTLAAEQAARLILAELQRVVALLAFGGGVPPILRIGRIELIDRLLCLGGRGEGQASQEQDR